MNKDTAMAKKDYVFYVWGSPIRPKLPFSFTVGEVFQHWRSHTVLTSLHFYTCKPCNQIVTVLSDDQLLVCPKCHGELFQVVDREGLLVDLCKNLLIT